MAEILPLFFVKLYSGTGLFLCDTQLDRHSYPEGTLVTEVYLNEMILLLETSLIISSFDSIAWGKLMCTHKHIVIHHQCTIDSDRCSFV